MSNNLLLYLTPPKNKNLLLNLPNEILYSTFDPLNHKDQTSFGQTCKYLRKIYFKLFLDPNKNIFYHQIYQNQIEHYNYTEIINKPTIKSKFIVFDSKEINSKSKSSHIRKRLRFNELGEFKCLHPLNSNYHLTCIKIEDFDNLNKSICEICHTLQHCSLNNILNGNCGISTCNLIIPLYDIWSFNGFTIGTNVTHSHSICESCFNNIDKTTNIPVINTTTFNYQ